MRGPKDNTRARARLLRRKSTEAEAALWSELRGRKLSGYKFARQVPIGNYFADFLCRELRIVIELDGSQHDENTYDERRDEWITGQGYTVLRLWNADIMLNRQSVVASILAALQRELPEQRATDLKVKFPKL